MVILKKVFVLLGAVQLASRSTAQPLELRKDGVCGGGIYAELAPILMQYPIAGAFCSAFYPVSCATANNRKRSATLSTSRTSSLTSQATPLTPSQAQSRTSLTTSVAQTKTTTASPAVIQDAKASAWSKAQQQPGNVISTLCACIETAAPCKTISRLSTRSSTPTTSSSPTISTTRSTTVRISAGTTASTTHGTTPSTAVTTTSYFTTDPSTTTRSYITISSSTTIKTASKYSCAGGPTTASNGVKYTVLSDTDFMGASDAGNIITYHDGTATLGDCINLCEGNSACVAVDFYGEDKQYGPIGRCFLLSNTLPGSQSSTAECAATRGPRTTSSSSSTISRISSTPTTKSSTSTSSATSSASATTKPSTSMLSTTISSTTTTKSSTLTSSTPTSSTTTSSVSSITISSSTTLSTTTMSTTITPSIIYDFTTTASTTTTTASTTTSNLPFASCSGGAICGPNGKFSLYCADRITQGTFLADFPAYPSAEDCRALCINDDAGPQKCTAFTYSKIDGECVLYSQRFVSVVDDDYASGYYLPGSAYQCPDGSSQ